MPHNYELQTHQLKRRGEGLDGVVRTVVERSTSRRGERNHGERHVSRRRLRCFPKKVGAPLVFSKKRQTRRTGKSHLLHSAKAAHTRSEGRLHPPPLSLVAHTTALQKLERAGDARGAKKNPQGDARNTHTHIHHHPRARRLESCCGNALAHSHSRPCEGHPQLLSRHVRCAVFGCVGGEGEPRRGRE